MLTDIDRKYDEWQLDVPSYGEKGQAKLRENDLNRQIGMHQGCLGHLCHEQAAKALRRFNPNCQHCS